MDTQKLYLNRNNSMTGKHGKQNSNSKFARIKLEKKVLHNHKNKCRKILVKIKERGADGILGYSKAKGDRLIGIRRNNDECCSTQYFDI